MNKGIKILRKTAANTKEKIKVPKTTIKTESSIPKEAPEVRTFMCICDEKFSIILIQ